VLHHLADEHMENYGGKTIIHTSWCESHL